MVKNFRDLFSIWRPFSQYWCNCQMWPFSVTRNDELQVHKLITNVKWTKNSIAMPPAGGGHAPGPLLDPPLVQTVYIICTGRPVWICLSIGLLMFLLVTDWITNIMCKVIVICCLIHLLTITDLLIFMFKEYEYEYGSSASWTAFNIWQMTIILHSFFTCV